MKMAQEENLASNLRSEEEETYALYQKYQGMSKKFKKGVSFQNYLEILGKKVKGIWNENICEGKRDQQQKPTRYGLASS